MGRFIGIIFNANGNNKFSPTFIQKQSNMNRKIKIQSSQLDTAIF